MEREGYLIVLKPEQALRTWEATPWVKEQIEKYPEAYRTIRRAFARFDPAAYRGISREPLEAINPKKIEEYKKAGWDIDVLDACVRMHLMLRDKHERVLQGDDEDEAVFDTIRQAREVFSLLETLRDYEIIQVRRHVFAKNRNTLGFDIGYWGGDHFSLIADTIVIPTWHGPPPEYYSEVAFQLATLNENLLFDSVEDAAQFKDYYKSKEWAETEDEDAEFWIIQVDEVKSEDE